MIGLWTFSTVISSIYFTHCASSTAEIFTNRKKKKYMMVKARKYVLKKKFHGLPKRDDFEIVEYELPPIQNGEILVKTEWVSVDPYLRVLNLPVPSDQIGMAVGIVEDSKDPRFPIGTAVATHKGWCDYSIINTELFNNDPIFYFKVPKLKGLSNSLAVGAAGILGYTAYFGLLDVCDPKAGETVAVTGAAGAIGSLVGQIAKIKGCKVIGFTGSDEKVKWLEELGFDKAINYKADNITDLIKAATPEGIDCFFDNVGGELSSTIMYEMRQGGRVAICGSVSSYNEDPDKKPKATVIQTAIGTKRLTVKGFITFDSKDRYPEALAQIIKWIQSGQLKPKEHITEGFDNIYDAFIGMWKGENFGKAIVKL
ncbi:hypothetical protein B5X24_HaOG204577 [Helicoverpa armigera]|nr:hypothetical protein B5X24_HaOG204577 [Helicoverpa armigera]